MALYATLEKISHEHLDSPTFDERREHLALPPIKHVEWHTGEKIPRVLVDNYVCVFVQADGHELDYLDQNFKGLPWTHPAEGGRRYLPIQKWRGDFAAFIFDHLPHEVK